MRVPPACEQPNFTLHDWIIVKYLDSFYLVGYNDDLETTRHSTAIASINVTDMTCQTSSGRHYTLQPPHATGLQANLLLEYFRNTFCVDVTDATSQIFANPTLLYRSFLETENVLGKLVLANSYLQQMTVRPMDWLQELIDYFTSYDVDPHRLTAPLNLNDSEWKLLTKGKLTWVTADVALRGWLLSETLKMIVEESKDDISIAEAQMTTAEITAWRIPLAVLEAREVNELLSIYRSMSCFKDIALSVRA